MSRIYEALKEAERFRSKSDAAAEGGLGVMELPDLRGSERRERAIDLTVYGHIASGSPFYERAKALRWNANGGLLLLAVAVCEGQDLLLINNRTSQEEVCHIGNVRLLDIETHEVAVSFSSPHPEFWQTMHNRGNTQEI